MWQHAARPPPSLRVGSISDSAKVVTVAGEDDGIVPLAEIRRLHLGSSERQCRLLVAPGEDHFLSSCVKPGALSTWLSELLGRPI